VIEGGWICRSCWKANRPGDEKCYRCKTPRDPEIDVAIGAPSGAGSPAFARPKRMDEQLGILAALVALPTVLGGVLGMIGSVLILVMGFVNGGIVGGLIFAVVAAIAFLLSWLWLFVGRSVWGRARWAYVVTAVVYLVPSVPYLLGAVDLPPEYRNLPDIFFTIQSILVFIYLAVGICAVFLLLVSFMDADSGEPSEEHSASSQPG
jgi:uncharacterized membrane protein YuzA (DUF378 family)